MNMNMDVTLLGNGEIIDNENIDIAYQIQLHQNILDEIDSQITDLTFLKKEFPKSDDKYVPITFCLAIGASVITPALILSLIKDPAIYQNFYGQVDFSSFYTFINVVFCGIPLGTAFSIADFSNFSNRKRIGDGIQSELEYLDLQREKEEKILSKLYKDHPNDIKNIKNISIDNKDIMELVELKRMLSFYYDLGYNKKIYNIYHKFGILDNVLNDKYSKEEVEVAKEYILSKRK